MCSFRTGEVFNSISNVTLNSFIFIANWSNEGFLALFRLQCRLFGVLCRFFGVQCMLFGVQIRLFGQVAGFWVWNLSVFVPPIHTILDWILGVSFVCEVSTKARFWIICVNSNYLIKLSCKGQIISKELLVSSNFLKKTNKWARFYYCNRFVCSLFGRIRGHHKVLSNYLTFSVQSKYDLKAGR